MNKTRRFDGDWFSVEDRGFATPCWIWTRALSSAGYGSVFDPVRRKRISAHIAVYEQETGPFPEGFQADHLCRVRVCVNPWHVEAVTPSTNVRRSHVGKLQEYEYEEMIVLYEEGWSLEKLEDRYPLKRKSIKYHLGLLPSNLPPRLRK